MVRGSGIFASGWGAQRAAVYGVPEEQLGAFYAQRTLLKREVLPEHVAEVAADRLDLSEVHRFPNQPVPVGGTLHWDILRLYHETTEGLRAAVRTAPELRSVGIDSWAVDYGLLDGTGALLGNPVHYRDSRTEAVMPTVVQRLGADHLYRTTGLQLLPFNTLRRTQPLRRYQPAGDPTAWRAAAAAGRHSRPSGVRRPLSRTGLPYAHRETLPERWISRG